MRLTLLRRSKLNERFLILCLWHSLTDVPVFISDGDTEVDCWNDASWPIGKLTVWRWYGGWPYRKHFPVLSVDKSPSFAEPSCLADEYPSLLCRSCSACLVALTVCWQDALPILLIVKLCKWSRWHCLPLSLLSFSHWNKNLPYGLILLSSFTEPSFWCFDFPILCHLKQLLKINRKHIFF